jgi:hypothetical protein
VRHGIIIRPESGYGPEVTGKNREPVATVSAVLTAGWRRAQLWIAPG